MAIDITAQRLEELTPPTGVFVQRQQVIQR
jgi:hypothetical protein